MDTLASLPAVIGLAVVCGIAAWGWIAWRGVRDTLHALNGFEHMHMDR